MENRDCPSSIVGSVSLSEFAGQIAVNPQTDRVYIASHGLFAPLTVINASTPSSPTIVTMFSLGSGVTVNPATNRFYTSDLYGGDVLVYDGATNSPIGSVHVGFCPVDFNVNPNTNLIYVYAQCGPGNDPVFVINGANNTIVAGPLYSGGVANRVFVNTSTGYFYANHYNGTRVFNASYNAVGDLSNIAVSAVNSATNRVYAPNIISGDLEVRDGTNLSLITSIAGEGRGNVQSGYAVDTGLNRIYEVDTNNMVLKTIDGSSNSVINTLSFPSAAAPYAVAVDSTKHRIYVTASTNSGNTLFIVQESPADIISVVSSQVGNLSTLNDGQKTSLESKLQAAEQSLARGTSNAAINQLAAFLSEVRALRQAGRLDAATADFLIGEIQTAIDLIQ